MKLELGTYSEPGVVITITTNSFGLRLVMLFGFTRVKHLATGEAPLDIRLSSKMSTVLSVVVFCHILIYLRSIKYINIECVVFSFSPGSAPVIEELYCCYERRILKDFLKLWTYI